MATTLIQNGAFCGAVQAIMEGRPATSFTPTDYDAVKNAAFAFATEFVTRNAALGAPMADADNAQIGQLCQSACAAVLSGREYTSAIAADYLDEANGAVALAKDSVASLI